MIRQVVNGILVGWFLTTVVAQYPDDSYARFRRLGPLTQHFLIPNWKFFAPNPGVDDYVLVYRTGSVDSGRWTEWQRLADPPRSRVVDAFYSPSSRWHKGILDIVSSLKMVAHLGAEDRRVLACRNLLLDLVRESLRASQATDPEFQIMVVRGSGYEESVPPRYDYIFAPTPLVAK